MKTPENNIDVFIFSFGFKHGEPRTPSEADLIFDVRDLPNPYWEDALRPFSGEEEKIKKFFSTRPEVLHKLDELEGLILNHLQSPHVIEKSKKNQNYLYSIGIGCTGGKHRSVFAVSELAKRLTEKYPSVRFDHRDKNKW